MKAKICNLFLYSEKGDCLVGTVLFVICISFALTFLNKINVLITALYLIKLVFICCVLKLSFSHWIYKLKLRILVDSYYQSAELLKIFYLHAFMEVEDKIMVKTCPFESHRVKLMSQLYQLPIMCLWTIHST